MEGWVKSGENMRMKIEFVIIKNSEFFLVVKHASVGGFWDWSNSYKGLFFVKKMVKNGGM